MKLDGKAVLATCILAVAALLVATFGAISIVVFIINVGWLPALLIAGAFALVYAVIWAFAYLENR